MLCLQHELSVLYSLFGFHLELPLLYTGLFGLKKKKTKSLTMLLKVTRKKQRACQPRH
jgi:hypothetical protein